MLYHFLLGSCPGMISTGLDGDEHVKEGVNGLLLFDPPFSYRLTATIPLPIRICVTVGLAAS